MNYVDKIAQIIHENRDSSSMVADVLAAYFEECGSKEEIGCYIIGELRNVFGEDTARKFVAIANNTVAPKLIL